MPQNFTPRPRTAERVGGVVSAAEKRFAGGFTFDSGQTATERTAAIQAAIDHLKDRGGTVYIPAPESPFSPAAWADVFTLILWPRINLAGTSALGARLRAAPGITSSVLKIGATDGSDPNWHWGKVCNLYIDGNKANQTARPLRTLTAATTSGYVATLTTNVDHGFTVGDVVEIAGVTPDTYNGMWRVESVPSTTTFTIQILTLDAAAATAFGTAQVQLNLINLAKGGETSLIKRVYGNGAFNSGIHQGTTGTPMRYENVSMFHNNDYGFDLWCDRPIQMDTPSGDFNGKGHIRLGGKSSAGGSGTDSAVLINNFKSEHHLVPALILDDYDGSVVLGGGSIDMEPGNTAPVIRRTAKSPNSSIRAVGLRVAKRASGAIFEDLSSHAASVTQSVTSPLSWDFHVSQQPFLVTRLSQKRNNLTESASITPNMQNGMMCVLTATLAARTINAPANPPTGAPNAQELQITIRNSSGAATTTTWNSIYKMAGWSDPAPNTQKTIRFWYDGTNWVQSAVSPDVPL